MWTELDVVLLWCSQRKISLQPEVCTVRSYKMTTPQNRKKLVSILVFFTSGHAFLPRFYDFYTKSVILWFFFFPLRYTEYFFFPFTFCWPIFYLATAIPLPFGCQMKYRAPRKNNTGGLGNTDGAGRFANYYAVCTSLTSHNCSFAI